MSSKLSSSPTTVRPSEYMRARHPELFSDTPTTGSPVLEKGYLEYHLESLTSRKQELVFEDFCRRLAEKEICPNLRPQTGPVGGGDSKTDTSTYPIAPYLAERCFFGTPTQATEENWAFAFSCKQDWRTKVSEDIEKIAKLGKFSKAIFITNQFVKDRDRAEVETKVSKTYSLDVCIHDRNWIVDRVFQHGHVELALEALNMGVQGHRQPSLGPRDVKRKNNLDELLKKLGDTQSYFGNDYAIAQDYLWAAKLARGLERPRHEIDGLFTRAIQVAKKHSYSGQIIRCGYEYAWTCFWWFDDAPALATAYGEIEQYIAGVINADECELFVNLWKLLHVALETGRINKAQAKTAEREQALRQTLSSIVADNTRPNNALHAETLLYLLDLTINLRNDAKLVSIFQNLKGCLSRSAGLGEYPAMKFIDTFAELGEFFGKLPGYDDLFQAMRVIAKERKGDISEGLLLFNRGMQLLDKQVPRDVLNYLGQARLRLAKNETKEEHMRASLACCEAYNELGLYWAARVEALLVAHTALNTIESVYEFPTLGIYAVKRLAWLELRLGRIGPFIAWYELSRVLIEHLRSLHYAVEGFENELHEQDLVLGCYFLNLSPEDIKELADFRDGLDRAGLLMANAALRYSIGEFQSLLAEIPAGVASDEQQLHDLFAKWKAQPAAEQLPKELTGETRSYWNFQTTLMNVKYRVKSRNSFGPVAFSENLLGFIEAALVLARWENLAFIVEMIDILIDIEDRGATPPDLRLGEPPSPKGIELVWGRNMLSWLRQSQRKDVCDYLMQLFLKILLGATIDPLDNLRKEMDEWLTEATVSRMYGHSPTIIALQDLIKDDQYRLNYRL